MNSDVGHIEFIIYPQNVAFYRELLEFLGWALLYEDPTTVGFGNEHGLSLWFSGRAKDVKNDYDGVGMNHLAISVSSQADVDQVVTYLKEHGVSPLFETPRHRPEFSSAPDLTYYQVMFESPDRILFEVVYTGPKQ